ncbi:MAG TPA: hypothetical protein VIY47_15445 [Ignavibacteriaceae bacterium]
MKKRSLKEWKNSPPPTPQRRPRRLKKLKRYDKKDRKIGKLRTTWRRLILQDFGLPVISTQKP